ncbi:hypothetical protein FMM74_022495 [Lachnospiraceae bacterium MD308]|nr:hypothetical protein [Lachnospiraceae bacterium MD308]
MKKNVRAGIKRWIKTSEKKEEFQMAANVESMFYVRETPWHGLGVRVNEAPASKEALTAAGLDWNVIQEPPKIPYQLYICQPMLIPKSSIISF